MTESDAVERALVRERERRRRAESALEEKSRELYESYCRLEKTLEELQSNQRQLIASEKMASLGVMSAGIAHEINNPIGYVTSNVSSLREYLPAFREAITATRAYLDSQPDTAPESSALAATLARLDLDYLLEDSEEIIADTLEGLTRVRDIVSGLRAFARQDEGGFGPVDLNACLESTSHIARSNLAAGCELELRPGELPPVRGSQGQLGQVFLNLMVNAGQAIGDLGTIRISSGVTGGEAWVDVADDGCGIPAENLDQLFTPFFTTKPVGQGTGLGLAISFGIVQDHGGRIEVDSTPGVGTRFRVWLPLAESTPA